MYFSTLTSSPNSNFNGHACSSMSTQMYTHHFRVFWTAIVICRQSATFLWEHFVLVPFVVIWLSVCACGIISLRTFFPYQTTFLEKNVSVLSLCFVHYFSHASRTMPRRHLVNTVVQPWISECSMLAQFYIVFFLFILWKMLGFLTAFASVHHSRMKQPELWLCDTKWSLLMTLPEYLKY